MKNFIAGLIICAVISALGLISVYGVTLTPDLPTRSVGYYRITPFSSGLALHEGLEREYYTLSPFNDYVIAGGIRSALITKEQIQSGAYTSDIRSSKWLDIAKTAGEYFDLTNPSVSFSSVNSVYYKALVNGNNLVINRSLELSNGISPEILGTTLTYLSGDLVFDSKGNLYTYQSQNMIDFFRSLYGINLTFENPDLRQIVSDKVLYIIDPDLIGVVSITAGENQTIWVNRNDSLVEIEEPVKPNNENKYYSRLNLSILDNPKKAPGII